MTLDALHAAHPYFAKFHYNLPLSYINMYTELGDTVLDPFCGSGTTLIAATAAGRNAIGIDANPLACLIARVKCSRPTISEVETLRSLAERATTYANLATDGFALFGDTVPLALADPPLIHNFDLWFHKDVIDELRAIKTFVTSVEADLIGNVARLAFSRIIVRASNQQGESVYRRVFKQRHRGDCWVMFVKALRDLVSTVDDSRTTLNENATSLVLEGDCRAVAIEAASCDLVVTSPPYLNSWDYSLYQKFRMAWLGYDPKAYGAVEIGNHLRTLRDGAKEIERYENDMQAVFSRIAYALKPGKKCIFVNGETVVDGEVINTDEIIVRAAKRVGMSPVAVEKRQILGPHYGNHASMRARKVVSKIFRDKTESMLTFVRA